MFMKLKLTTNHQLLKKSNQFTSHTTDVMSVPWTEFFPSASKESSLHFHLHWSVKRQNAMTLYIFFSVSHHLLTAIRSSVQIFYFLYATFTFSSKIPNIISQGIIKYCWYISSRQFLGSEHLHQLLQSLIARAVSSSVLDTTYVW